MRKTYNQLITEAAEEANQSKGPFGNFKLGGLKDVGISMAASAVSGLIAPFFQGPNQRQSSMASTSRDAATQQRQNREFKNASTLDQKQQTARAKMNRSKQPLGTQPSPQNRINVPKTDLSGQKTELA